MATNKRPRNCASVSSRSDAPPHVLLLRAGHDGTGTRRAVASITSGMRWKPVHESVVCRGKWDDTFLDRATELGTYMAAGLESGIFWKQALRPRETRTPGESGGSASSESCRRPAARRP